MVSVILTLMDLNVVSEGNLEAIWDVFWGSGHVIAKHVDSTQVKHASGIGRLKHSKHSQVFQTEMWWWSTQRLPTLYCRWTHARQNL